MSKVFKYYYDFMSQPSRALWISLQLGKISYEDCPVALRKREQQSEEYRQINRFRQVPAIVDGDFHLSESVAILRYLADKGQFSEALYPKAPQQRARIDEFLEWHHLTLRFGCSSHFFHTWFLPMNGLAAMPPLEKIDELLKEMERNLKLVEKIWLRKSEFLTGDQINVADIFGACEIEQTKLANYDMKAKFPKISDWMERVRQETNPYYDEAHKFIYKKSGIVVGK